MINKYNLQIKNNNGVEPKDYYKGNGIYKSYVETKINGKKILIYYYANQFWLEVDDVPILDKRVPVLEIEDMYDVEYNPDKFFKYVNKIIDKYKEDNTC